VDPIDQQIEGVAGGQRSDRHERLVEDPYALAAGGQDPDPRAGSKDLFNLAGHLQRAALAAVEDDQTRSRAKGT
jgi:hypothetical protein